MGYELVDAKFLNDIDSDYAAKQLIACMDKTYNVKDYFERPQFSEEIETFINATHFGVVLGANKIGKSVWFKKYSQKNTNIFYFDLSMFQSVLNFRNTNPCSILRLLDLQRFAQTVIVQLTRAFRNSGTHSLPVIIFDQADSMLEKPQQSAFLEQLVSTFIRPSFYDQQIRVFFMGSQEDLIKVFSQHGTVRSRTKIHYATGFRVNEACILWVTQKLVLLKKVQYEQIIYHNRALCALLNNTLTLPSAQQIQTIDSALNANFILDKLSFFLELYKIAGDQYKTFEMNKEGTISKVGRLFRSYRWHADKYIFDDQESVQFLKQLIRITTSNSFDGLPVHEADYAESLVAGSYLVRIETQAGSRDFFYFRIPYFRELVIQEFKKKKITWE